MYSILCDKAAHNNYNGLQYSKQNGLLISITIIKYSYSL